MTDPTPVPVPPWREMVPTDDEFVDWLDSLTRDQRRAFIAHRREAWTAEVSCWEQNHRRRLDHAERDTARYRDVLQPSVSTPTRSAPLSPGGRFL